MRFIKINLVVCLLFINTFFTFGQSDRSELNFLEQLIRQSQPEGQIIYTDKISKGEHDRIKSRIKKTTIYDISTNRNQKWITLTRKEKIYIFEQLEIINKPFWKENLFPESRLIKDDEVNSYLKKTTQDYLENYNNPNNTGTDRMTMVKNYQKPAVFKFAKPVYLRNRTLCLIYSSFICGNPCGFDELSFYKIENNTWTKWVVVSHNEY